MTITPAGSAWADAVASAARARVEAVDAALAAASAELAAAAHATDWRSPSARAFHEEANALRGRVALLRDRAATASELAARVQMDRP